MSETSCNSSGQWAKLDVEEDDDDSQLTSNVSRISAALGADSSTLELDSLEISPTNNSGPPIVSSGALTELDLSDNGPGIADSPPMATTNTLARVPHPLAIRLRRNSLISLPKWLSRLSSLLQQLDLADNQFTSLPRALVNFERLQELRIDRNELTSLPSWLISSLPRLQFLYVASNNLKTAELAMRLPSDLGITADDDPDAIEESPPLQRLELRDNKLEGSLTLAPYQLLKPYTEPWPLDNFSRLKNRRALQHEEIFDRRRRHLQVDEETLMTLKYRARQCARVLKKLRNLLPPQPFVLQAKLRIGEALRRLTLDGILLQELRELDVSENSLERLDVRALRSLETLRCARNRLERASIHGRRLRTLLAGNNCLKELQVQPEPDNLQHLDLSYNELETLPAWLPRCSSLRVLFASRNRLRSLPDAFLRETSPPSSLPSPTADSAPPLQTLQLSYNQLVALPTRLTYLPLLQELFLQSNSLAALPDNLFEALPNLRVMNLSNNRLCSLPFSSSLEKDEILLEKVYLSGNCLAASALEALGRAVHLRTLHIAYNCIQEVPEDCGYAWPELEELVLSGNRLESIPAIWASQLPRLRVLRLHSNRLRSCPPFANMHELRVLDLAYNRLERVDLESLAPQGLTSLDLSGNPRLHVDPRQFRLYRAQRPLSLVDVSGRERSSLPSTPESTINVNIVNGPQPPWRLGFAEVTTNGPSPAVAQVRLGSFCNSTEALLGLVDVGGCGGGGGSRQAAQNLAKALPRILLEHRSAAQQQHGKATAGGVGGGDYLKKTLLSAVRERRINGRSTASATLIHVASAGGHTGIAGGHVIRIASLGEARVVLCRAGEALLLPSSQCLTPSRTIKPQSSDSMTNEPLSAELSVEAHDELLVVANESFWRTVTIEEATEEARSVSDPGLAAKRLQDLAHSYGSEDELSIMVLRFHDCGESDALMRELRATLRGRRKGQQLAAAVATTVPPIPCPACEGRSSPSGQSDHEAASSTAGRLALCPTATSDEQFKCWEYMLEQNSQLLLDRELDTLSRGLRSSRLSNRPMLPNYGSCRSWAKRDPLWQSSPHLGQSFFNRQFGSTRSATPSPRRVDGRLTPLMGGPHAAYFSSLQRLAPYSLECDLLTTPTQQRQQQQQQQQQQQHPNLDSLEALDRIDRYWGVATTEL